MKKLTLILSLFALTFGLVGALFNTFALFSRQKQIPTQAINYRADSLTVEKLAKALRYETITGKDSFSLQEFNRFQTFLIENFPTVHSSKAITYIPIGANGRLYRWKGVDFNPKANLWLAAQDVAEPNLAFIPQWRFNPFVGKHEKGIIYGAGANKHKFCLLATLQAWENELKKGFAPKNDLYLFAPADFYSPISTQSKALTAIFYTQDLRFKYVLIAENYIATANNTFTDKNIAWIGTNQKNMLHLRLKSTDSTQIKSFEACLHAQTNTFNLKNVYNRQLLEFLSPELSFGTRFLFANEFLCAYFINNKLLKDSFLSKANRIEYIINRNDTVQTENRTAQTKNRIINNTNVYLQLPQSVNVANFINQLKQNTSFSSFDIVEKQIFANIAPTNSWEWGLLERLVKETNPNTIVVPAPAGRGNAGGYFQLLSPQIYYFSPVQIAQNQANNYLQTIDEQLSVENYNQAVAFYAGLLRAN